MKKELCIRLIDAVMALNTTGYHAIVEFGEMNEVKISVSDKDFKTVLKVSLGGRANEKIIGSVIEELERMTLGSGRNSE